MRNCLVVCATKQQSACKVAAEIAKDLRLRDVAVDLECSSNISSLEGYDAVVIGAPLCHGRWQRSTRRFSYDTRPHCREQKSQSLLPDLAIPTSKRTTARGIA